MKKLNYLATTALAASGLLLLGSFAAKAQDALSPTGATPADDDLIAAFWSPTGAGTGGGDSYEVDLGTLASLGSSASFSLNSDLTSTFGTWTSDIYLKYTVFSDDVNTGEFWTLSTGTLGPKEETDQSTVTGNMDGIITDLGNEPYVSSGDKTAAMIGNSGDPQDIGSVYGTITDPTQWGYGSAFGSGANDPGADTGLAYDFFAVPSNSTNANAPAVGTFTLTSGGNLEFQSVPEPSTWASIMVGAVGLLAFRRRRMA
jgi:hypothetical protein